MACVHKLRWFWSLFANECRFSMKYCTSSTHRIGVDVESCFIRDDVQRILRQITGFDVNKVFSERRLDSSGPPKYKLLTTKQLEEYEAEAMERGHERLQMPPVKNPWKLDDESVSSRVLSRDNIANFEKSTARYVFTDISLNVPRRQRVIAVREPDGTLRLANPDEQDRILNIYYPIPDKMYSIPKMFSEENLEKLLAKHRYEYVLDRACLQFEPDDPEFIRVTRRTYDHVANAGRFTDLWSTRHFGPMAFHLIVSQNIDALLTDMLQRQLLTDAADTVRLHHIVHEASSKSAAEARSQTVTDDRELILTYCRLDARHGGSIELALQTLTELSSERHTSSAA